jgi:hypothetical protein
MKKPIIILILFSLTLLSGFQTWAGEPEFIGNFNEMLRNNLPPAPIEYTITGELPSSQRQAIAARKCMREIFDGPLRGLKQQFEKENFSKMMISVNFQEGAPDLRDPMVQISVSALDHGWSAYNEALSLEQARSLPPPGESIERNGTVDLGFMQWEATKRKDKYRFKYTIYYSRPVQRLMDKGSFEAKSYKEGQKKIAELAKIEQKKFELNTGENLAEIEVSEYTWPKGETEQSATQNFGKTSLVKREKVVAPIFATSVHIDKAGACFHNISSDAINAAAEKFKDLKKPRTVAAEDQHLPE